MLRSFTRLAAVIVIFFAYLLCLVGAETGYVPAFRRSTEGERGWAPYRKSVSGAKDLDEALQERWNRDRLIAFTQLNPPEGITGKLPFKGKVLSGGWSVASATSEEQIQVSWVADYFEGRIVFYQVSAKIGKTMWLVETSLIDDLRRPPYLIAVDRP